MGDRENPSDESEGKEPIRVDFDELQKPLLDDAAFADLLSSGMPEAEHRGKNYSRYKLWRQLQQRFPEQDGIRGIFGLSRGEKGFWFSIIVVGGIVAMGFGAILAVMMVPEFPEELGIEHGVGLAIELRSFYLESGEDVTGSAVEPQRSVGFRVLANHEGYAALFIAEDVGPPSVLWEQQLLQANQPVTIGESGRPFYYSLAASDQPTRVCAVAADSPSRLKTFVGTLDGTRSRSLAESCITMRVAN